MKKVLLVCDGSHFSEGAFQMAAYLQTLQPMLLTGVFLGAEIYKYIYYDVNFATAELVTELHDEQQEQIEYSEDRFAELCNKYGIEYRVHEQWESFSLEHLQKEMRFADLSIIGSEAFYKNYSDSKPNSHLKAALQDAECPVLLVPENFERIDKIILAYDGSESSVFAIKQFANLLPDLCSKNTLLLYMDANSKEVPDLPYIEELAARRFSDLTICKLDFNPQKYFSVWVSEQKNSLVVAGSYEHSGISGLFHQSFVKEAIQEHDLPLFIAHK